MVNRTRETHSSASWTRLSGTSRTTKPRLRFVDELSQSQIAQRVGISQVDVSRLLARGLTALRSSLAEC